MNPAPASRLAAIAGLMAVIAVASVLRLLDIGRESFWLDEAHSVVWAQRGLRWLWTDGARYEVNPPLYFSLLKYWMRLGTSDAWIRSLSAIAGVGVVAATAALAGAIAGLRAALIAGLLLAIHPVQIHYAQEARPYALASLGAATALAGAAWLLGRERRTLASWWPPRDRIQLLTALAWGSLIGGEILAIYCHSTLLLLPAATAAVGLAMLEGIRSRLRWVIAHGVVGLAYLPWIVILRANLQQLQDFWIPGITLADAVAMTARVYTPWPWPVPGAEVIALTWMAIAAVGLGLLWRDGRRDAAALLAAVIIGVPVATFLVSLHRPVFIPRVLVWPTTALVVAVAVALARIPMPLPRHLALAVVASVPLLTRFDYRQSMAREPWRDFVATLAAGGRCDDLVVIVPDFVAMPFERYAGQSCPRAVAVGNWPSEMIRTPVVTIDQARTLIDQAPTAWVVARLHTLPVAMLEDDALLEHRASRVAERIVMGTRGRLRATRIGPR